MPHVQALVPRTSPVLVLRLPDSTPTQRFIAYLVDTIRRISATKHSNPIAVCKSVARHGGTILSRSTRV
jgi:hypothetical protein